MKAEEVPLVMTGTSVREVLPVVAGVSAALVAVVEKLELLVTFSAAFLATPLTASVEDAVFADSKVL